MNLLKLFSRTFLLITLLSINFYAIAQVVKVPLTTNVVQMNYAKLNPHIVNHQKSLHIANPLGIPFFEDFSTSYVYPDTNKWINGGVFVNDDFPINPPSIGVATFDGLDSVGIPYANTTSYYYADTLTSQPIDLSAYSTDSTLFLSFFYQSGGNGNTPDIGDSLILQFLNKDTVWITVWGVDGTSTQTDFKQVFVHISDTILFPIASIVDTIVDSFRYDKFQFRFMNIASGYGMLDIWNVDYIYLNNHRDTTDTTMIDNAFVYRGASLLKNYSQMPWQHYLADPENQLATQYPVTIRNNDINSHFLFFHSLIYQYANPSPIFTFPSSGAYGFPIDPQTDNTLVLPMSTGTSFPSFPTQPGDFAEFTVVHFIDSTASDNVRSNDTIKNVQRFSDYYAYDDGTAEQALYLANAPGGELAMQFTTTKADTLQGVYMFFPQMVWNTSLLDFSLAVWKDNGGVPGTLIYKKIDMFPQFNYTELNGFHYYKLDSNYLTNTDSPPLYLQPGTYYFGYIQGVDYTNNDQPITIGLDVNTNWDSTKLFINVINQWEHESSGGSVMIRPVFGSSMDLGIKNQDDQLANTLDIFPNPASNKITLRWTSKAHIQSADLLTEIFDPQGRLILSQTGYQSEIDISSISEGFYFAKITDTKSGTSFTKKLIINR